MNATSLRTKFVIFMAGFTVLNALMIWEVRDRIVEGYSDFAAFYTAGKILQRGQSASLYHRDLQWQIQQEFASKVTIRSAPLPYIRPPFEALIFLPLAYFRYPIAFVIWMLAKIAILIAFPFFLPRDARFGGISSAGTFFQGLLWLGFFPVAFDLLQGQDSILLLLIVTFVFWFLERRQDFASGFTLGLGLFKFHLVVPIFLVFLLRRKLKIASGFLVAAFVVSTISLALVGWNGLSEYPRYLWRINQSPWLGGFDAYGMPNIRGLLTPLLGKGRVALSAQMALLAGVAAGIIVVAQLWRERSSDLQDRIGFSLCIVTTILCSYYANSYDFTLFLLVFTLAGSVFARIKPEIHSPRRLFLIVAAVLLISPLSWVLALRIDRFSWSALVLVPLVASLAAVLRKPGTLNNHAATSVSEAH